MGNYTIFYMFENPRRGRQARNFATNVSKNARSQIVFRTDIFRKLTLGAPVFIRELKQRRFWAMQVNRKRELFPWLPVDHTNFELLNVFTLLEAICSKTDEQNHSPNMQKVHLRLTCVALKHLYFRFSLFSNATGARRALWGKEYL